MSADDALAATIGAELEASQGVDALPLPVVYATAAGAAREHYRPLVEAADKLVAAVRAEHDNERLASDDPEKIPAWKARRRTNEMLARYEQVRAAVDT